jgi:tetratricopeptide (TPR) repeat protein
MKILLIIFLSIFIITPIISQDSLYITDVGYGKLRNLTLLSKEYQSAQKKRDGLETSKGKSIYQKEIVRLTHYFAIDLMVKEETYTKEGKLILGKEYGNLAWYYLFEEEYEKAAEAAIKGLELAPSQTWIKTNLGHSYLLLGNYKKAKKVYKEFKELKQEDGKKFKEIILEDLIILEEEGIEIPKKKKIRKYLKK